MKIAVRFSPAKGIKAGSQNTIAEGLIPELVKQHGDIVLFTSNPEPFQHIGGLKICPTREIGTSKKIVDVLKERIKDQLFFERDVIKQGCNIIYYPYSHDSLRFTFSVPQVITVHDLIPSVYPELFPLMSKQWRYLTFPTLRGAKSIVTVSMNTKKDLVTFTGIESEKIHIVPNGFRSSLDKESIAVNKYGEYILYVSSSRYPYKNITGLIEAYAKIKDKILHKLMIVGKSVPRFEHELKALIDSVGLVDQIMLLENLDNDEIANVYRCATLFVYPSKYEGFGIPPLEAMSYGIPVVASNATSIPEVCGDAALYFDPYSADSIAEAIMKGLSDQGLRGHLISKGHERINSFQWSKAAESIIEICKNTLLAK